MFYEKIFVSYNKSLIRDKYIDGRLLLVMAHIMINANMKGITGTTLENIIKDIGYLPNANKGKTNDVIIDILKFLEDKSYITVVKDTDKITLKGFLQIQISKDNNIFNMSKVDETGSVKTIPFVQLTETEFDKITKNKTRSNKSLLVKVFLSIKSYINFSEQTPNICFPAQSTISKHCNKTKGYTINNTIKELVEMGILFEHVTGGYMDKYSNIKNANNVYAIQPDELKNADSIMLDYYNNEKGISIDSFYKIC